MYRYLVFFPSNVTHDKRLHHFIDHLFHGQCQYTSAAATLVASVLIQFNEGNLASGFGMWTV